MSGVLVLAGYLVGWMIVGAIVARSMADEYSNDAPDFLDSTMGALVGLLWPLMIFPIAIKWLAVRETPSERRDRLAVEKDARIREQARTIERLEREAGIR